MTLVFVFSRASAFSIRISSFVHARNVLRVPVFVSTFFAISVPHAPVSPTNSASIVNQKNATWFSLLSSNLPKPTNKHAV